MANERIAIVFRAPPGSRVRFDVLISATRVEKGPAHDRVALWNRGGYAGEVVVQKGDGEAVAARLEGKMTP